MSTRSSKTQVSGAVLAGGQSRRMGRDKSLLELDGTPMIERVLDRLAYVSDDLLVITNTPEKYAWLAERVRFAHDLGGEGWGPLAGIGAALVAARHEAVVVVATDMPFLNTELLAYLARQADDADVVVPVIEEDRPETMHAVYRTSCLPAIKRRLEAQELKITGFFDDMRVREVPAEELRRFDPGLTSFLNANTPEQWVEVQRLVQSENE